VKPEGAEPDAWRRLRLCLGVLVATGAFAVLLLAPGPGSVAAGAATAFRPQPGHYYLTAAELRQIRAAIATRPAARAAWAHTKAGADGALTRAPAPAPSKGVDYRPTGRDANNQCSGTPSGWACLLYARGLHDGVDALNLGLAFAITGERSYAVKAKEFLLAWARTYDHPNPTVSQNIAEPGGFMLKGFMAFDLVQGAFTEAERAAFKAWAGQFIAVGKERADHQVDSPGLADQTFAGERSNWQRYGNSATYARALAVAAAAVAGDAQLRSTLEWNWRHTTRGGNDNGWASLIDGEIIDGTGGETFEGRGRNDIGYGLLGSNALLVVADIAKHAGFRRDLFAFTTRSGDSVLSPFAFYGKYLSNYSLWPASDGSFAHKEGTASTYRAATEVALRNSPPALKARLRKVVNFGGAAQRGSNYDPYIWLYAGLGAAS